MGHGKINKKKMAQRLKDINSGGRGDFYKLTKGKHYLRFLPPIEDRDEAYYQFLGHYLDGFKECLGKKCPACLKIQEIREEIDELGSDKKDKKLIGALKKQMSDIGRRERAIYQFIDLNDDEVKICVANVSKTLHGQILLYDSEYDYLLTDPQEGYDVTIVVSGPKNKPDYVIKPDKQPRELEDEESELLDNLVKIDGPPHVEQLSEEEMIDLLKDLEGDHDDEEEDRPSQKKKSEFNKKSGRRKKKDEDKPECFGDGDVIDPESGECDQCEYFDECDEAVDESLKNKDDEEDEDLEEELKNSRRKRGSKSDKSEKADKKKVRRRRK